MNNRQDIAKLEAYLDGELNSVERAEFENELSRSAELKAQLEEARTLKQLLSQMPAFEPDASYFEEVTDIILARTGANVPTIATPVPSSWSRSVARLAIPVAASLILFFGALSLSSQIQDEAPVVIQLNDYEAITAGATSNDLSHDWDLGDDEISDMAVGISIVGTPGRAAGFADLSDVISVRLQPE